jgi:hypothetical protein
LSDGAVPMAIHVPIGMALAGLAFFFVSRRFEYQTDSYAAWLTGDPEALITGLVKLHRLSLMPLQWGKWDEHLLTHPSTSRRLEAIARENGLSKRRLNEILDAAGALPQSGHEASEASVADHYDFPKADAEAEKVFSKALRNKAVVRQSRINLAVILLVPALAAGIAHWAIMDETARCVALAGGVVATAGLFVTLQNYLPVRAYPAMQRRLLEKLQAEGLTPPETSAFFVGLSPDSTPRIYQSFLNWDIGFLFLTGDRLLYVGEKTRFALRREQINSLRLEWDIKRWWRVPTLYITWQDSERGTSGTFNVRRGDQLRTMRQMAQQTCELHEVLTQWRARPATATELPPPLTELTSPAIGEVTSVGPAVQLRLTVILYQVVFLAVFGVGVSWLCGFPFDLEDGTGWYVPAVAASMILFAIAPNLWQRTPLRE